jgi:hypothetical protein
MDKKKIINELEKEYNEYLKEFETSEYMDIDKHTKWSLSVGKLINDIKNLQRESEWLYGKLNQIGHVLEAGRKESKEF